MCRFPVTDSPIHDVNANTPRLCNTNTRFSDRPSLLLHIKNYHDRSKIAPAATRGSKGDTAHVALVTFYSALVQEMQIQAHAAPLPALNQLQAVAPGQNGPAGRMNQRPHAVQPQSAAPGYHVPNPSNAVAPQVFAPPSIARGSPQAIARPTPPRPPAHNTPPNPFRSPAKTPAAGPPPLTKKRKHSHDVTSQDNTNPGVKPDSEQPLHRTSSAQTDTPTFRFAYTSISTAPIAPSPTQPPRIAAPPRPQASVMQRTPEQQAAIDAMLLEQAKRSGFIVD